MKKISFLLICTFMITTVFAQDVLKEVKLLVFKTDWIKARTAIDKVLADPKNATNAEAWYWKGAIYNVVSKQAEGATTCSNCKMEAFAALKKYQELDPKNTQMAPTENIDLFDIYNGFFDLGGISFGAKNFDSSLIYFKMAQEVQEYLNKKGFSLKGYSMPVVDTSLVLNTGLAAYNAKNFEEATFQFKKLADINVNTPNYENTYELLAEYYSGKKDLKTLAEITEKAHRFYPENDYWAQTEMDVVNKSDKMALLARYEEVTVKYPGSYFINYNYCTELYNFLYASDEKPSNRDTYKVKLVEQLKKTIPLDKEVSAVVLMARHFYNEGFEKSDEARTIKGTKPEDVKKRTDLNNGFKAILSEAIPYAETAIKFYHSLEKLKANQKNNYKLMLNMLKDIYEIKGDVKKSAEYKASAEALDK